MTGGLQPGGLRVGDLTIRRGRAGPVMIGPVSFQAAGGSTVGLVGETGAGKTLVLRALMGLLPAGFEMAGEVQIGTGQPGTGQPGAGQPGTGAPHQDSAALRAELGRRIGVVLQSPFTAFDPLRPVGKQVTEGVLRRRLMSKDAARGHAASLLRQMGFDQPDELGKLFPNQLSGGMAQRIAIAMSVMPSPAVLLADEPTSALDATLRIRVLELLQGFIRRQNAVLVMVSHDLGLMADFSQQLIVLYSGRVVESGAAGELLARPRHPYTQALIACTPKLAPDAQRELSSIPGSVPSPLQRIAGCRFAARCPIVTERCRTEEPLLRTVGDAQVACHLAEKALARHD
ncbi:MAG: ABC transporter ATP-binding protein [Streptosporangiaceae bacterium]